jgi:hypothetical protein
VPLKQLGGAFIVPVTVNNTLQLAFTIDSGASDAGLEAAAGDEAAAAETGGIPAPEGHQGSRLWFRELSFSRTKLAGLATQSVRASVG